MIFKFYKQWGKSSQSKAFHIPILWIAFAKDSIAITLLGYTISLFKKERNCKHEAYKKVLFKDGTWYCKSCGIKNIELEQQN